MTACAPAVEAWRSPPRAERGPGVRGRSPRSREDRNFAGQPRDLQELLRPLARRKSLFYCGLSELPEQAHVTLCCAERDGKLHAWWRGTRRCGCIWGCAGCSARKTAERGEELERVIAAWGGIALVLHGRLSIRHTKQDAALDLRRGLGRALSHMQDSRVYRELQAKHGFEVVLAQHVTRGGRSGWNVHLHPEFFFFTPPTDDVIREVRDVVSEQWRRSVRATMGKTMGERVVPLREHGFHLKRMTNARYVANWALELTATQTKEAKRGGHLTTWQIGYRAAMGNAGYVTLWDEFLDAFKGAQSLRWPRAKHSKLRKLRDVVRAELEAQEKAREDASKEVTDVPSSLWRLLKFGRFRGGHFVRAEIQDCIEARGDAADVWGIITDYLNARGTRTSGDGADDALWRARDRWREAERERLRSRGPPTTSEPHVAHGHAAWNTRTEERQ